MLSFTVTPQGRSISCPFACTSSRKTKANRREMQATEQKRMMTLKTQLSESELCSAPLQRRKSDLKPLTKKHICPKPSGCKAASHHKLASLSPTEAVPSTGVYWCMKRCISHLPVSYNPPVYVSTKDGMKIPLTTRDSKVLFYNSSILLPCNSASKAFHCHGESRKNLQTLGHVTQHEN